MNIQCSSGSRSLAKETRALKMRGTVDGHWKLTNTKWEHHQRWSSYNDMRSHCELSVDHSFQHLQQSGKVKNLNEWVPHELIANQKDHNFEVSSSLILCKNNEPFLDRIVTCDKTWVLYDSANHQLSGGTEKKLKSTSQFKIGAKKGSCSLFGSLPPVWSTIAFWIQVKPLCLRSILSKRMNCTKNCDACSQHWSTECAQFFCMTIDHTLHNQLFKSWMNRATKCCFIQYFHLTAC